MAQTNKTSPIRNLLLAITGLALILDATLITFVLRHLDDHPWQFNAVILGILLYLMLVFLLIGEHMYRRL